MPCWLRRHKKHISANEYTMFKEVAKRFETDHKLDPVEFDTADSSMYSEEYDCFDEYNKEFLEYERRRLAVSVGRPIVLIAFLDKEDKETAGYKLIRSGIISDCLQSENYNVCWYIDPSGDFRCTICDGLLADSYYLYRVVREGVTPDALRAFLSEILDGHIDSERIEEVTERMEPKIKEAYQKTKSVSFIHKGR